MANEQEQYERLRKYLNPAFRGKNTEAVLRALATNAAYLVNNVEAVHDQCYIISASERYLDQRLADYNLIRPVSVGLSDDIYRNIGISTINRKQVRDLIGDLLTIMFGEDATQATAKSAQFEPYNLDLGDVLIVSFDGQPPINIEFTANQFASIDAATAQEVADAITKTIRAQGKTGRATAQDDGAGGYVTLNSDTNGPSSTVVVLGGRAQNEFLFDKPRPATTAASTQWTVASGSGNTLRFTWSGGANPSIGKIRVGDYVNIFSSGFDDANNGTFTIVNFKGGSINNSYFEINNPNGVPEIAVQGTVDGMLFFQPFKNSISTKRRYAALYQEESRLIEIFIPATTKVVRRDRKGSSHLHDSDTISTTIYDAGTNEIADITVPAFASISDGQYFLLNSANDAAEYYVYFDTTGGDLSDPAVFGKTGIRVDISAATTALDVAIETANILNGNPDFGVSEPTTATIRINNLLVGATTNAANFNVPTLTVSIFQQGSDAVETTTSVANPDVGLPDLEGPYCYDLTQPFVVSHIGSTLQTEVSPDTGRILQITDASQFPDNQGHVIIGYGTSHQEGPIPYLARPSSNSILLNPGYQMRKIHPVGADISIVAQNSPVVVSQDGTDFPFYVTDVVAGREYAEDLIREVAATGINVVITILYPNDIGLGKWGTADSERVVIWGT